MIKYIMIHEIPISTPLHLYYRKIMRKEKACE